MRLGWHQRRPSREARLSVPPGSIEDPAHGVNGDHMENLDFYRQQALLRYASLFLLRYCQRRLGGESGLHHHPVIRPPPSWDQPRPNREAELPLPLSNSEETSPWRPSGKPEILLPPDSNKVVSPVFLPKQCQRKPSKMEDLKSHNTVQKSEGFNFKNHLLYQNPEIYLIE